MKTNKITDLHNFNNFESTKNRKTAYLIGRDLKICKDCGFKLCTCQTKLSEFELEFKRMLDLAIIQSRRKDSTNKLSSTEKLRIILLKLSRGNSDFKEFLIRYGVYNQHEKRK